MKEIAALLQEHAITKDLEPQMLQLIEGCAHNVVFEADSIILEQGKPANEFYLIRHGKVALELFASGRGVLTFLTLDPGEMLGASWLVAPYRWNYDARAMEMTRAIAFDAKCLREKCDADPRLGYELMKRFVPILLKRMQAARLQSANVFGSESEWQEATA